jgi:prefoldin subunit 5
MGPSEEMNMLRTEAESMKRGLDEINRRIEELEKRASE